ncbi:MAG: NADH-quinone oxidoreductase subunit C [Pseudomonadota bacterium]
MSEFNKEQKITDSVAGKFGHMKDKMKIKRARRISAEVEYNNFRQVFDHVVKDLDFKAICMITGLDEGENLSAIYHLCNFEGVVFDLKTSVPKSNPVLNSIGDAFPGAILYERELIDMFGMKVQGLPEGHRYPLPDGWPDGQYPLRKDWTADMLDKGGK